jgi:hypothetical protein
VSDPAPANLADLRGAWLSAWPAALACWSRFVQLSEPRWCLSADDEKRESLSGSFAMIRLVDHAVVISLRQVQDAKLDRFAVEILAHEIGHHVYCPADLSDHARVLARTRAGLPTREKLAPMIANLYTDLLINDHLQRTDDLDMAGVYAALAADSQSRLWTLYMRIYEHLWSLPRAKLATGPIDPRLECDAQLGARLIRSYAKDWLDGSGRFAALCLPYVLEDTPQGPESIRVSWHDTACAGDGGLPDGLCEIDDAETDGAIHPSEDPNLTGLDAGDAEPDKSDRRKIDPSHTGRKTLKRYRGPVEYADVLKASGVKLDDREITARYYRERAIPHLVRFPVRTVQQSTDPIPEGHDLWDVGGELGAVDWLATLQASPAAVIPGVTTRQRLFGDSPGSDPQRQPVDLYLGVDCSGSMGDPAYKLSFPVLAGAVIALSALRVGAKVMVALSGEPGQTITTDGFVRDEKSVLKTLTSYLGTGAYFGVHRLDATFRDRPKTARPCHILIVSDNDIYTSLNATADGRLGWDVAREAAQTARGGATYALELPQYLRDAKGAAEILTPGAQRMRADGWRLAPVATMEELMDFAKRFTRQSYAHPPAR